MRSGKYANFQITNLHNNLHQCFHTSSMEKPRLELFYFLEHIRSHIKRNIKVLSIVIHACWTNRESVERNVIVAEDPLWQQFVISCRMFYVYRGWNQCKVRIRAAYISPAAICQIFHLSSSVNGITLTCW